MPHTFRVLYPIGITNNKCRCYYSWRWPTGIAVAVEIVPNLFLCGTVMAGIKTETIFIENGREHAKIIATQIAERLIN